VPDGPYVAETLSSTSGGRLFVPGGATVELTAALSALAAPTPAVATIRINTQGLPRGTRIYLDGQLVTSPSEVEVVAGQPHLLRAEAQDYRPDSLLVTALVNETRDWIPLLARIESASTGGGRASTPRSTGAAPAVAWSDTFNSPQLAVETFLRAVETGSIQAIQQVWSGATEDELLPWRTFLTGKRIQEAVIREGLQQPNRTGREAEFTPLVSFTYLDTANARQSIVQIIQFVVYQGDSQWRISRVTFLGADD
jgi:hypothetical protein